MAEYSICKDALLQLRDGKWLLSNPRTRTHVALDERTIGVLSQFTEPAAEDVWLASLSECKGWDATDEYFGEQGLHADHTGVQTQALVEKNGADLVALLRKRWLLLEEGSASYTNYFQPLQHVFDRQHIGTFHQRVGQFLTVKKRLLDGRWRWWHDQKFASDGRAVRPGPYKNIQENFIKTYLPTANLKGLDVLDFACGNGFYSSALADAGANVTGIDTASELIDIATQNYGSKASFAHMESIERELAWLAERTNGFDVVFMQDVFLLLLNPEDGKASDPSDLLRLFYDVLRPNGQILMMEPNPVFWLASRYGDPSNPYAVVTEYQDSVFNVAPQLPMVVSHMAKANFGLVEYVHPSHASDDSSDDVAKTYANEFAIWDFMRFRSFKH